MTQDDFKKKCSDFSRCALCPLRDYDALCLVASNLDYIDDDYGDVHLNFEQVYEKVKIELWRFEKDEKSN